MFIFFKLNYYLKFNNQVTHDKIFENNNQNRNEELKDMRNDGSNTFYIFSEFLLFLHCILKFSAPYQREWVTIDDIIIFEVLVLLLIIVMFYA